MIVMFADRFLLVDCRQDGTSKTSGRGRHMILPKLVCCVMCHLGGSALRFVS